MTEDWDNDSTSTARKASVSHAATISGVDHYNHTLRLVTTELWCVPIWILFVGKEMTIQGLQAKVFHVNNFFFHFSPPSPVRCASHGVAVRTDSADIPSVFTANTSSQRACNCTCGVYRRTSGNERPCCCTCWGGASWLPRLSR